MTPHPTSDPATWAEATFGSAILGDSRRTRRVVAAATAMATQPAASLPRQAGDWAALKGIYRVLDEEDVTFAALMTPHWQQTRQVAARPPLALLVQDTTELNYTRHPAAEDLGPIGNENGRGYLLHSVLAVHPERQDVLGLLHQEPFLRTAAPPGENTSQRLKRNRESQVWGRAVEAVGAPPDGTTWVHVGDRGSDVFPFLSACRAQQVHFLVRACQNRRVDRADDTRDYLLDVARQLPGQGTREVELPARAGCAARRATLHVATTTLTLVPPVQDPRYSPLPAWVIRVWEVDPPATVDEPVAWVLVTSVATTTVEQAWERVAWYTCRWMIEDYHQGLKTGCQIEHRQFETTARLWRLLGLCSPIAVRLLQLRQVGRLDPERPAVEVVPAEVVAVVAAIRGLDPTTLTAGVVMGEIARFGGYLGRRRDGPPGWKTLWHGWQYVHSLVEGVRLAQLLSP